MFQSREVIERVTYRWLSSIRIKISILVSEWHRFETLYGKRCMTSLCWYDSGESVVLGPEITQQTTKKIKMIQEKIKASQSHQKSYHDKRMKSFEFQEGDQVFLQVTLVIGVDHAMKSRKLTLHFIGPYQIMK